MFYDTIVGPIGTLVTCQNKGPRKGEELRDLPVTVNGAVGIKDGKIAFVGNYEEIKSCDSNEKIDASKNMVMPGFVDCHTHIPFLGDRSNEMIMRFEGKTYMEIAKSGGGILSTMKCVRFSSEENLYESALKSSRRLLENGTTTFEGKSGYGLDFENEIKQLKVLKKLGSEGSQKVVSTCLSAHFLPPEYKEKREKFIELITEKIIPFVSENKLADFVDVFCENGAFTVEETREILLKAKNLSLKTRVHADEIENFGGAKLAAEIGCVSADHLLMADDDSINLLAEKGVIAVLLPATAFFLRKPFARARKFIEKGCVVAVASDLNPGSSYTYSMFQVLTISVFGMHLFPEEAIWASTLNAAYALSVQDEVGSIEVGKRADLTIWDVSHPIYLFYPFGEKSLRKVIAKGKIVYEN
ncbi:MAG: imidazolonepropionase [Acidobacteria bacterium]|nr:imidazolonepropionase [Acidobacteriota bacterium]